MADVFSPTGSSDSLRRETWPSPPGAVHAAAHRCETRDSPRGDCPRAIASASGRLLGCRRLRGCRREVRAAIARGDVYQVNLVQHLAAPFDGDPPSLAAALAPLHPLHPRAARRRRLGDRLRVARALPRATRRPAMDEADQGHPTTRRGRRRPEGRCRARDDRRPQAQRSLARLRAGNDPLARADGAARARRCHAPRLDRRGAVAPGRRPRGDPAARRSRAARSPVRRRSPRSTTSRGSSPSGAARRWGRSAPSAETATSSSP